MNSAAHRVEREPEQDPRNAILDMVEAQLRMAIDLGLEPQLRARVERMLPPAPVPSAGRSLFARADTPSASRPALAGQSPDGFMHDAMVLFRKLDTWKLTRVEHETLRQLRELLVAFSIASGDSSLAARADTPSASRPARVEVSGQHHPAPTAGLAQPSRGGHP